MIVDVICILRFVATARDVHRNARCCKARLLRLTELLITLESKLHIVELNHGSPCPKPSLTQIIDTLQGSGGRQTALFGSVSEACARFTAMRRKPDTAARAAEPDSLSKAEAERAVNALLEAIRAALASGEAVSLAGFGTFSARSPTARQGRNPATGERIAIAASKTLSFRAGKALRHAVLQP